MRRQQTRYDFADKDKAIVFCNWVRSYDREAMHHELPEPLEGSEVTASGDVVPVRIVAHVYSYRELWPADLTAAQGGFVNYETLTFSLDEQQIIADVISFVTDGDNEMMVLDYATESRWRQMHATEVEAAYYEYVAELMSESRYDY